MFAEYETTFMAMSIILISMMAMLYAIIVIGTVKRKNDKKKNNESYFYASQEYIENSRKKIKDITTDTTFTREKQIYEILFIYNEIAYAVSTSVIDEKYVKAVLYYEMQSFYYENQAFIRETQDKYKDDQLFLTLQLLLTKWQRGF